MHNVLHVLRASFEDVWEVDTDLTMKIEAIKGLWPNEASVGPEE